MDTFAGRLRGAMIAKGLRTPEDLSRATGIPIKRARALLKLLDCPMAGQDLAAIAAGLQCRMYWLVTGKGRNMRRHLYGELELRIMAALERMSVPEAKKLLSRMERRVPQ